MSFNAITNLLRSIKRNTYHRIKVCINRPNYNSIIKRISQKSLNNPIRVCFLVTVISKWKDEELYKLFAASPYFDPIVIGTPYALDKYNSTRIESQRQVREYCLSHNYHYSDSYDESTGIYKKLSFFAPDIVFLCEPYEENLEESYKITGKKIDYLPCHTPYGYWTSKIIRPATGPYHATTWRQYYCSEENRLNIKRNSLIGDRNVKIVGYQTFDVLSEKKVDILPWKNDDRKKIIIAPHYSVVAPNRPASNQGSFLMYADYLLEIVEKYKSEVQFAFKPHPLLYVKLLDIWGKEKTNQYYAFWQHNENTIIAEGDYIDLFKTSDAMIHDSGSFVVEYLYTKKPTMFIAYKEKQVKEDYNDLGAMCVDLHYKAYRNDDIDKFISEVVIKGNDTRRQERSVFVDNTFYKINGKPAAENIYDDIFQNCIK